MTPSVTSPLAFDPVQRRADAASAKAWPFEEARKLVARYAAAPPQKGYVLFETGYGPSGLPHIGTFGEVARTAMVRRAFECLSDIPTKLFCFSDDMDGLRKVPTNVPNQEQLHAALDLPLTKVPDPFGEYESFGHHNNAMLRRFLDQFGFEYEFQSATERYRSGAFDATLLKLLTAYDEVMAVMLPTLGAERQQTYSPFLPISPATGKVLQVPILERKLDAGTVVFTDEDGSMCEVPVTGGHCKLQWKPDWAMRWVALGVDYEMAGKDLIDSVKLGAKIAKILGGQPPEGFNYELFLDEEGKKISKSKGNGLTIDEWLTFAPPSSLAYYMHQQPRRAKRLSFDVISKAVDEYLSHLSKIHDQTSAQVLENPVWHIHGDDALPPSPPVGFGMLLNLAGAANALDKSVLWGFISRYAPDATPDTAPLLDAMAGYAVAYYQRFVKPTKQYRAPTDQERAALRELGDWLRTPDAAAVATDAEALQQAVYDIGKRHAFEPLRAWFGAAYEVLMGQTQGPRLGSFIAIYGTAETAALIDVALAGKLAAAS